MKKYNISLRYFSICMNRISVSIAILLLLACSIFPHSQQYTPPIPTHLQEEIDARNTNISSALSTIFPRSLLFEAPSSELSELFHTRKNMCPFSPYTCSPIFNEERTNANLVLGEAKRDISITPHEITIQNTFREVADALVEKQAIQLEKSASVTLKKVVKKPYFYQKHALNPALLSN